MKHYLVNFIEQNGEKQYSDRFLIKSKDPVNSIKKILIGWCGARGKKLENMKYQFTDGIIVKLHDFREIPKEHFNFLIKNCYLLVID